MPPTIAFAAPAARPWVLPPKLVVSAATRRMLLELVAAADEEDDDDWAPAEIVDLAEFRARRTRR